MSQTSNLTIDSHQHFWKYDPVTYSWINENMFSIRKDFFPEDLRPVLQKNRIDGCVSVQADQSEDETKFLLNLAAENLIVKAVVGWVDLSAGNVSGRLDHFAQDLFFKGVRHTVYDDKGEFMLQPAFQRGIAALSEFGLTYDILAFDYQLPGAIGLVKKFPDQPFVLDHMGKPRISSEGPSMQWKESIRELASYRNSYCKLSGMVTETTDFSWKSSDFIPYLDVVVEAFGVDRVMYCSD